MVDHSPRLARVVGGGWGRGGEGGFTPSLSPSSSPDPFPESRIHLRLRNFTFAEGSADLDYLPADLAPLARPRSPHDAKHVGFDRFPL